jgi:hypothetical protein
VEHQTDAQKRGRPKEDVVKDVHSGSNRTKGLIDTVLNVRLTSVLHQLLSSDAKKTGIHSEACPTRLITVI